MYTNVSKLMEYNSSHQEITYYLPMTENVNFNTKYTLHI